MSATAPTSAEATPAPTPPDHAVVPAQEREAEHLRWVALGLRVPDDGPVLNDPFAEPLTRRSFVVPASWFEGGFARSKPDARVRASLVRQDLDVLERAMRMAYGGGTLRSPRA